MPCLGLFRDAGVFLFFDEDALICMETVRPLHCVCVFYFIADDLRSLSLVIPACYLKYDCAFCVIHGARICSDMFTILDSWHRNGKCNKL